MDEVYTCECGGQHWVIYGQRIKCVECGNRYLLRLMWPKHFNLNRGTLDETPNGPSLGEEE